jgi:hypothetical protein
VIFFFTKIEPRKKNWEYENSKRDIQLLVTSIKYYLPRFAMKVFLMKTLLTHHQPFHISIHVLSTQVIVESQPTSNGMKKTKILVNTK